MALVVLSVVEQRLDAVRAVRGWQSVVDVAAQVGVSRSTLHRWVGRYLEGSVAGLADRSHRPGLVSAPDRRLGRGRGGGDPAEASALGATPIRLELLRRLPPTWPAGIDRRRRGRGTGSSFGRGW